MGNKVTFIDQEFPSEIADKFSYLPAVDDVVDVTPSFQCSSLSSIEEAGNVAKARITSVRRGFIQKEQAVEDPIASIATPTDWNFIVLAVMLESTTLTPYCHHAHGHLDISVGQEVILRHSDMIGTMCTPKGWIVKNSTG